jgi:twinkle protein
LSKFPDSPRGVIIDPWNEIEHTRGGMSETDYISKSLSTVRNWARLNNVHVWIVAHPAKQRREEGKLPVPRPDMISGSVHWWNKADNAIAVARDYDSEEDLVDIYIQKVRFKHVGEWAQSN